MDKFMKKIFWAMKCLGVVNRFDNIIGVGG